MRIALVKLGEPVPGEGIRPRRMTLLAEALARAGHEVTWWTSDWSHQTKTRRRPDLAADAERQGFTLRMLEAPPYRRNVSLARIAHHDVFARRLVAELDKGPKPDLLWVCFPAIAQTVWLARWANAHGVPMISDVRDLSPDVFESIVPSPLRPLAHAALAPLRQRVGRAFASVDGLVAVSAEYLAWAERLARSGGRLPPQRAVLPLGYDLPTLSAAREAELAQEFAAKGLTAGGRLRAVFAGTFGVSYDIATLIEAARRAEARNIKVEFVLAGGGDGAPMVEAAAREIDRLHYVGWLDGERLQYLLAHADFGLMAYGPNATQGLPNKLYEYMANGLVVLNSLRGESAALIEETAAGINYPPGDADALLDAITTLAGDTARRKAISAMSLETFVARANSKERVARMVAFAEAVATARDRVSQH
jgi:glycosyltransferase involved in cell wall biosynthesis